VIETPTPINETTIQGKFLREHINDKAGCCGAKELLKLYSYRMTQFDWVVHVDVDVMFLKGLDSVFQMIDYSILYTTDPNMAGSKLLDRQPAQVGLLKKRARTQSTAFAN
jgi:alpha-N-acetylglucosamine transferase